MRIHHTCDIRWFQPGGPVRSIGRWRASANLVGSAALAILASLSCTLPGTNGDIIDPDDRGDLVVTGRAEAAQVFEGFSAVLNAEATGGTPPYSFRWDVNAGPDGLSLTDPTSQAIRTDPLITSGRYVFRVVVTDSVGLHSTDFVVVEVNPSVTAFAPELAVVDQPVTLTSTVPDGLDDVDLFWAIVGGDASLDEEGGGAAALTTHAGETVVVELNITINASSSPGVTTRRTFEIASVFDLHPRVEIETNLGSFVLELDGEASPRHTANFLLYLDDGFFDGVLFHRNACTPAPESDQCPPFVLQGGGFERVDGDLVPKEPTREPVISEADNGLTNGDLYSVALALAVADPDSGTTQFFVNLADNSFLDDQAFTVFGRIAEGVEVIDAIVAMDTIASTIIPGEDSLPAEDVVMENVRRVDP